MQAVLLWQHPQIHPIKHAAIWTTKFQVNSFMLRHASDLWQDSFELGVILLRKKLYTQAVKNLEKARKSWEGESDELAQVSALGVLSNLFMLYKSLCLPLLCNCNKTCQFLNHNHCNLLSIDGAQACEGCRHTKESRRFALPRNSISLIP